MNLSTLSQALAQCAPDIGPRNALSLYESACWALSEARTLVEVKDVADRAAALKEYGRLAKDRSLEIDAAELRIRAERRLGEMLKATPRHPPGPEKIGSKSEPIPVAPTLDEIGIDKKLSSRAQKLASITEHAIEARIARWREQAEHGAARVTVDLLRDGDKKERRAAREVELGRAQTAGNLTLPDKRYGIILADWPRKPWAYSDDTGADRSPANHYPVQTFSWAIDVLALMIQKLAAPDCMLAFWSTAASLIDDIEIMAEAGFVALRPRDTGGKLLRHENGELLGRSYYGFGGGTYRSHLIWDKQAIGMGRWFRDRHELLLIGVRGKFPAPAPGTQSASIFSEHRGEHSAKPEFVAAEIDRLWPNLPKIELFGRGPARPGWDSWGLDASGAPTAEAAE